VTEHIGSPEQSDSRAQEVIRGNAGRVSDQVRRQLDQRSTTAGEQVAAMGRAIRDMGGQLRSQGNEAPARVSEEAAERVERLGRYLRDADGRRIMADIEDFGHRQPWVVAAAGLTVGAMAARFLKASSRDSATQRPRVEPETIEREASA
jgi:hypothetical protein